MERVIADVKVIRSNDFLDEMFVFEIWFCAMSWLATYPQLVWFDPQTVTLSVCAPGEVSAWRIGRYRGTPLDSSLAPILYTMGTQQTWRY